MAKASTPLVRRVLDGGSDAQGAIRHRWRSSLSFRVIVTTMVLGLIMLLSVGTYLYRQVADGLYGDSQRIAAAESLRLTEEAQRNFLAVDATSVADFQQSANTTVASLVGTEGTRYVVLARIDDATTSPSLASVITGPVGPDQLPPELADAILADPSTQHWVSMTVPSGDGEVPAIAVGQQVDLPIVSGVHAMFFIYPLERESATITLVARTFFGGGLALLLLVGAIAYAVTRLVVVPVREAAAVAVGFADGHLDQRMSVSGEDDLARLASSFNEMAASLQQQIAQLENLSLVQQRFVSDVSHELRTPLTTIRMAADLIHDSRTVFEPSVARSAELLHNQLDRFELLLTDLLEISRFDAGAAALDVEATDIRGVVARVVEAYQPLAERRGSTIRIRGARRPVVADVDVRRIERILRNLVVNAIEHGEGQPIEVRLGQSDTAVAVTVTDHGVGLKPGEKDLVFTRFWRADPARARTTGGTGLGLAISLEDARLHLGTLDAEGQPGRGSTFRLTIPKIGRDLMGAPPLPLGEDT